MQNNAQRKIEPAHVEVLPQIIIALHPHGVAAMTRDMELIRRILLEIKSRKDVEPRKVILDGVDEITLLRHVEMLCNGGFVETRGGVHYSSMIGEPDLILVTDMSWDGHDFIAALENESVWNKLKSKFSPVELASLPLGILKEVGLAVLKDLAMGKLSS